MDGSVQILDKQFVASKTKFGTAVKDAAYRCFLFEDVLLTCKEIKKTKTGPVSYKFKSYVYTRDMQIKDKPAAGEILSNEDVKCSWEYTTSQQKSYIVICGTPEDKDRWVSTLNDCVAKSNAKPANERGMEPLHL